VFGTLGIGLEACEAVFFFVIISIIYDMTCCWYVENRCFNDSLSLNI
jgi:hypothetical protein